LLVTDLEIFMVEEQFIFNNLRVGLRESIIFEEEFDDFVDVIVDSSDTFGGYSTVDFHLEHLARLVSVLFPVGAVFKFFHAL